MSSLDISREINERLQWELVLKSTTAAPTLVVIAFGVSFYQFGITFFSGLFLALTILCGLNSAVRLFIGKLAIQKKIEKNLAIQIVLHSLTLNVFFWSAAFLIVFLQTPITSLPFAIAFMISLALVNASVMTLSYRPGLATCYQLGILSGIIICFGQHFWLKPDGTFLFMFSAMILLALYYIRQTRDFHLQMVAKYKYEVELEISVQQLKESNSKLVEETARAENASRLAALGDMAGGMAHEINTPLTIIQLRAEEILAATESLGAEELKKKLNSVVTAANRIARIIKSLLQISRKGEVPDIFENIKVKNLLDDVMNIYHEKFLLAGVEVNIAEIPDIEVTTKQALVSQVLLTLFSNAFDQITHQGAGSADPKYLNIFFKVERAKLILCVANSGPAISKSVQAKLFQPFFTTKEVGSGSGLGLSVCKGVFESLKERIWFDKMADDTTFCFSLPVAVPKLD